MLNNEIEIIRDCQNGDLEKFSDLYNHYIDKIYKFIYYRVSDKNICEDIISDVFLKALENIKNFDLKRAYFSAWLYKIAYNSTVDYYRQKKDFTDIDSLWDLGDDNFLKNFNNNSKIEEIKKYLENFSNSQKEIIIMRVWDDLSYKEISEITGKSEASLKMSVSRILSKLRKDISPIALLIIIKLIN